jgi:DNA-binding LacI/PurR family transcriptional regulator
MDAEERGQAPARPRRPAVMADVGRLAGVSHRDPRAGARGDARARPNPIARALVTGRSRTLGVVSFDTTLFGPASTLFAIERAAHEAGYFIIIASLKALNRSSVTEAVDRLQLQSVDGILVIVSDAEAAQALIGAPFDLPLVAVEAGPVRGIPVVAVDQLAGAAAATRHLLELGHRTVWHLGSVHK